MANTRITMRKLQELLRLRFDSGLSERAVARSLNISRSTVHDYLLRFAASGLGWPIPSVLSPTDLERKLFPDTSVAREADCVPDWAAVHQELKRKGMTLGLLWREYKADHPDGYGYSRFCELYRRYAATLAVTMRQQHKAGERLLVDYAGQTVPVTDPATGEVRAAQNFVAVMGASNYSYAEATWSQTLPDWIDSHIRAFEFFGGVTELIIPDNLKSGVTKPSRYDPDLNPTYREMARHYDTAVMPARVRKPRDKAQAEGGVLLVERWILAVLRKRTFFSLEELNKAIWELLDRLNFHPFKKLPGCRHSEFLRLDRPVLKPLPIDRYQMGEWKKLRVNPDYHVEIGGHHYSVPYQLVGEIVDIRHSRRIIEIFHQGARVASHAKSNAIGGTTTVDAHRSPAHQRYLDWEPAKIMAWAEETGYETYCQFQAILADRPHPQIAYRACLGIIRLEKDFTRDRIEAACLRANLIGATRLDSVRSILDNGLDRVPVATESKSRQPIAHENIRGAGYYASKGVWALPS